jgi:hypothetical protein
MLRYFRNVTFVAFLGCSLVSLPALADDVEIDEGGGISCGSGMAIQYGSDVSQGAAQNYCETLACGDVCTSIGCDPGSGASSSASGCSTCTHQSAWDYRSHGTCNCTVPQH